MKTIETRIYNGLHGVFGIASIDSESRIALSYYKIVGDCVRPLNEAEKEEAKAVIEHIIARCKDEFKIDCENWITDYELISF